jgi:protein-S-isoprenylcysteine O-methyltransferase Ste14
MSDGKKEKNESKNRESKQIKPWNISLLQLAQETIHRLRRPTRHAAVPAPSLFVAFVLFLFSFFPFCPLSLFFSHSQFQRKKVLGRGLFILFVYCGWTFFSFFFFQ